MVDRFCGGGPALLCGKGVAFVVNILIEVQAAFIATVLSLQDGQSRLLERCLLADVEGWDLRPSPTTMVSPRESESAFIMSTWHSLGVEEEGEEVDPICPSLSVKGRRILCFIAHGCMTVDDARTLLSAKQSAS